MNRDDLIRFASRDWQALDAEKLRYWAERKATMTPADLLAVGDALRTFARRLRPTWPSAQERAEDLEAHRRVNEALRAVHVPTR